MPYVITILLTLAALGIVFLVFLAWNTIDGWRTWRAWRRVNQALRDLDAALLDVVSVAREQTEQAKQSLRRDVASIHKSPLLWPCKHDECPYKTSSGE